MHITETLDTIQNPINFSWFKPALPGSTGLFAHDRILFMAIKAEMIKINCSEGMEIALKHCFRFK